MSGVIVCPQQCSWIASIWIEKMLRFIILSLLSLLPITIGCSQTCSDPLTSTPFGSPCVCVLPMKVRLLLGMNVLSTFQEINELEKEIAAGTSLKQSQVVIRGVVADSLDQEKAVVDIDLIPLRDKFSNSTIVLIHQRFIQKKVHLNGTLFGDYDMLYIKYPGPPDLPSSSNPRGTRHPEYPISVDLGGKKQKMNRQMIFIIALSALVLLMVCFAALAILYNRKKVGMSSGDVRVAVVPHINKIFGKESEQSSRPTSSSSGSFVSAMPASILSVITFSLAELERATENFSSENVLGEGGFGRVYHGIMGNGTEVAVKLLKRVSQNGDFDFISEVKMLSRLHHRNLVKLIGICVEGGKRCLVYELVSNGSLESHLHGADRSKGPLSWDARLKIALGAARGLAYLHEDSNPCVIHRDFKSSNVLLEDDFTPKVSDFGLAREAAERSHHISTRVMGTFGYVAPEYAMTGHLLVKSDVYSYGVVLLELLTGRKPVELFREPGQENLVMWARPLLADREALHQLADPALSGTYDPNDLARVAAIASICVHLDVAQRPFMGEVVQALKLVCKSADENYDGCSSPVGDLPRCSASSSDFMISDGSWWSGPGGLGPGNRSEPLGVMSERDYYYRLRGSMSEHSRWAGTGPGGCRYDAFF